MDGGEDADRARSGGEEPGEVLRVRIFQGLESAVMPRLADEVSRTLSKELVSRIGIDRLSRMDLAVVADAALQQVQRVMDLPPDEWPEGGLPALAAEVARSVPTPRPSAGQLARDVFSVVWGLGVPLLLVPLWWKPFGGWPLSWKAAGTLGLLIAWVAGQLLAAPPGALANALAEVDGGAAERVPPPPPPPLSRQQKGTLVTGTGFLLALVAIWWKPLGGLDWEMKALASAGAVILWMVIDHLLGFEE